MILYRKVAVGDADAAPLITCVLQRHWANAPYHLRLELMEAAQCCRQADQAGRASLIEVIEALPPHQDISVETAIMDALQSLGAFEASEREHQEIIREEINQCLADPDNLERCAAAYGIYVAQFDHPYSGAYYEVISNLPYGERMQLLMMAANGADYSSFLLPMLIIDLASFGDPKTCENFSRWTALPPTDSAMPQDAIEVFVNTHVFLAQLACPLPASRTSERDPSAEALAACGAILYWCNRTDLDESTRRNACHHPMSVLMRHDSGASIDVLRHCEQGLVRGVRHLLGEAPLKSSIVGFFPSEVTEICRHALRHPEIQTGYFRYFDRRLVLEFAMNVLAHHGNTTDAVLLRRFADDPNLGTCAIAAVKILEENVRP